MNNRTRRTPVARSRNRNRTRAYTVQITGTGSTVAHAETYPTACRGCAQAQADSLAALNQDAGRTCRPAVTETITALIPTPCTGTC